LNLATFICNVNTVAYKKNRVIFLHLSLHRRGGWR